MKHYLQLIHVYPNVFPLFTSCVSFSLRYLREFKAHHGGFKVVKADDVTGYQVIEDI